MKLSEIKYNIIYKITSYNVENYRRFFELGFFVGSKVKLIRYSILKKSMLASIDGVDYMIRIADAKNISVEVA